MLNFTSRVLSAVRKIKPGETKTYKQIAKLAGSPQAYRAVGNILHQNYDSGIPCHRVVRSDGTLGGYNRGKRLKQRKLRQERLTAKQYSLQ